MTEPWESNPVSFIYLVKVDDYDFLGKTKEVCFVSLEKAERFGRTLNNKKVYQIIKVPVMDCYGETAKIGFCLNCNYRKPLDEQTSICQDCEADLQSK